MYVYIYIYAFLRRAVRFERGDVEFQPGTTKKQVFKIAVNVAHQEQKKTEKYQRDKIEQSKENKNRTSANKKEQHINPH